MNNKGEISLLTKGNERLRIETDSVYSTLYSHGV